MGQQKTNSEVSAKTPKHKSMERQKPPMVMVSVKLPKHDNKAN
jgi:hypothetical protein